MKRKIFMACAAVVALVWSCTPKSEIPYEYRAPEFKNTYKAEIVPLNKSVICSMCSFLEICDDKLILGIKNIDNENVFQVFSMTNGRFLRSFATKGRGDNELLDYFRTAYDRQNYIIYAVDNSSQYQQIDARKAANGDKDYIIKNDLGFSGNMTLFIRSLSNGRILHTGLNTRYFSTNDDYLDTLVLHTDYPAITPAIDADTAMRKTYMQINAHIDISPNGEKLVTSTHYGMVMEAFDVSADKLTPRFVKRFYEPKLKNAYIAEEGCIDGTCSVLTTDKYIYVTYCDSPQKNVNNVRLGVFDWDGRGVACYEFDNVRILKFNVTPDNNRVYCWVKNSDGEEYLGYFDLK